MKLKIYFLSVFIIAFTLLGYTPLIQAQDNNTRAIACNGCNEKAKQQLAQKLFSHDYPQGEYRFVIIDMQGANVHEYDVNVPAKNVNALDQSPQQTTVTLIHRADHDFRNQRISDVKAALKEIDNGLNELFGKAMSIPENSGYVSAYSALKNKTDFNTYISNLLTNTSVVSSKIHQASLAIQSMAESLQIDTSTSLSIALTTNTSKGAWVSFADSSKILVGLKFSEPVGESFRFIVTTTLQAVDKNRTPIPHSEDILPYYNFSDSGLNESAFQSYFNSIGITIEFNEGWTNRSGSCDTKWACSSNKKTCELQVSNCQ